MSGDGLQGALTAIKEVNGLTVGCVSFRCEESHGLKTFLLSLAHSRPRQEHRDLSYQGLSGGGGRMNSWTDSLSSVSSNVSIHSNPNTGSELGFRTSASVFQGGNPPGSSFRSTRPSMGPLDEFNNAGQSIGSLNSYDHESRQYQQQCYPLFNRFPRENEGF